MITEARLREFFAARCRVLAARSRVPSPQARFTRYTRHGTWHVCPHGMQALPTFDDPCWIEVVW